MIPAIALRFKPYCLEKKVETFIPGTLLGAEIYPTFLRLFHMVSRETLFQKEFSEFGSLQKFTVFQDLEKNRIEVTGSGNTGFIRYFIEPGKVQFVKGSAALYTFACSPVQIKPKARLCLGCHRAQDATLIVRRGDLEELVPIVYALSQSLGECDSFQVNSKIFLDFLAGGLKSLFYPESLPHQGITLPASALQLLKGAESFIRELFFLEQEEVFHILPALFPEFHAGRFENIVTKEGHQITLEWTKKSIRQVEIIPACDSHYQFKFSNDIQRFRLRARSASPQVLTNGAKIKLTKGLALTLDRFER